MISFEAKAAAHLRDEDIETEMVILAEHEDGSGRRIEIQRSLAPTEQDRRHGMDTYCLVDQDGAACYGGVAGWSVRDDVVVLDLDGEASAVLAAGGGIRVRLASPDVGPAEVERHLRALLQFDPV